MPNIPPKMNESMIINILVGPIVSTYMLAFLSTVTVRNFSLSIFIAVNFANCSCRSRKPSI